MSSTEAEEVRTNELMLGQNGGQPHTLYPRRYIVLAVLCIALFINGEAWMTFGAVTSKSETYFNATSQEINWYGNIFLLAYAVESIPCTFLPQLIGLKWVIVVGCTLNFIGACVRYASILLNPPNQRTSFFVAMFGNLLFGFAQGFLLNIPSLVSARWFGEEERSVSTSVAFMSNAVGVGTGFIAASLLAASAKTLNDLYLTFSYIAVPEAIISFMALVAAVICVKSQPPTPPSYSEDMILKKAETQATKLTFVGNMKEMVINMGKIMSKYQPALLVLVFATYYGNYTTIFIFLSEISEKFVKNPTVLTGYAGAIGVIIGGAATILAGYFMKKVNNRYLGAFLQFACKVPLLVMLLLIYLNRLENTSMFVIVCAFLAACTPYISVGCELLAELTYPLDPNISSNTALILGNIFGVLMTFLFGFIWESIKYYVVVACVIGLYLINFLILIIIRFKATRSTLSQATN